MALQLPAWSMTYAADRRKHRHRCVWCNRIMQPGDPAFMCRTLGDATRVAHEACVSEDRPESAEHRAIMREWAFSRLLNTLGLSDTDPRNYAAIGRLRNTFRLKGRVG